MSTDYREKEREFLDSLEEDTGRDLRAWMSAITDQDLPHRNDIIDWLRQQGFMFSKASWLERVHHNGGRPIYSDAAIAKRAMPKRPPVSHAEASQPAASEPELAPPSPVLPPVVATAAPDALDAVLATAKAYRPLAQHILREIAKMIPGAQVSAAGSYISLASDDREFAVLTLTAKELRLGLALAAEPFEAPLAAAKFPNPALRISPAITHMVVLTDVRQIDGALAGWITKAAAKPAAAA